MSDEFEELTTDIDDVNDEAIAKTPNSKKINVYFQSTIGPSDKSEKMMITIEASVSDIKYTVGRLFSLDPEDFHLSYAGRTMDPDDIIGNYEVEEGDTLLLIPISVAGSI